MRTRWIILCTIALSPQCLRRPPVTESGVLPRVSLRTSGGSSSICYDRRRCTGVLLRRSRVAQGHRKQLRASGAADGRPPHQQPRPRRCPVVVVADFCNKIGPTLSDFHQSSQMNFSDWPQRAQRKIRKVRIPSRTSEFARSILLEQCRQTGSSPVSIG
jgi:hypothetical protein